MSCVPRAILRLARQAGLGLRFRLPWPIEGQDLCNLSCAAGPVLLPRDDGLVSPLKKDHNWSCGGNRKVLTVFFFRTCGCEHKN